MCGARSGSRPSRASGRTSWGPRGTSASSAWTRWSCPLSFSSRSRCAFPYPPPYPSPYRARYRTLSFPYSLSLSDGFHQTSFISLSLSLPLSLCKALQMKASAFLAGAGGGAHARHAAHRGAVGRGVAADRPRRAPPARDRPRLRRPLAHAGPLALYAFRFTLDALRFALCKTPPNLPPYPSPYRARYRSLTLPKTNSSSLPPSSTARPRKRAVRRTPARPRRTST